MLECPISRRTVDTGTSLVADGMSAKTLQFWSTQADHSRPVTQPLGTHGRRASTGSTAGQPVCLWQTNEDDDDPQYQHIDADCQRGMMELFREDSSMTTHTTGTGSALGFEANGVHGAVELCGLTSLPRKSVAPRRSERPVVCWVGDRPINENCTWWMNVCVYRASYWSSIAMKVTRVTSCHVSEILQLLYAESHIFNTPP